MGVIRGLMMMFSGVKDEDELFKEGEWGWHVRFMGFILFNFLDWPQVLLFSIRLYYHITKQTNSLTRGVK